MFKKTPLIFKIIALFILLIVISLTVLFNQFNQSPISQPFWSTKSVDCSGNKLYFSMINNTDGGIFLHQAADFINLQSKVFGMSYLNKGFYNSNDLSSATSFDIYYRQNNSNDFSNLKIARKYKSCFGYKNVNLYDGTTGYRCYLAINSTNDDVGGDCPLGAKEIWR